MYQYQNPPTCVDGEFTQDPWGPLGSALPGSDCFPMTMGKTRPSIPLGAGNCVPVTPCKCSPGVFSPLLIGHLLQGEVK